ncbi:MAG TPA: hypothetical protein VD788_16225 [Candidatus Polarisedimenticolaceae bacterium]|nr:hypothetical protein [Candidatus Polarisedimenticolaceae bacterium]
MLRKGRRLFTVASVLVLVVASAHTLGMLSEPREAADVAIVESMQAHRFELGLGMSPSVFDIQMSLGLTMTVFLVFVGVGNLVIAGRDPWIAAGVLRFAAVLNATCMWVLVLLYWFYRIPPPLISFALLGLLFSFAVRTTRDAGPSARSGSPRPDETGG